MMREFVKGYVQGLAIFASVVTLLILISVVLAHAQVATPNLPSDVNATKEAVSNSSGNVAASTATATLPALQGRTTAICGMQFTSAGSTAGAAVTGTITNIVGGTMSFTVDTATGAAAANNPVILNFNPCLPATTQNQTIVISVPSLGAGNTNATLSAWGYRY